MQAPGLRRGTEFSKQKYHKGMDFARPSHKCAATARKFVVIRTSLMLVLIYKFWTGNFVATYKPRTTKMYGDGFIPLRYIGYGFLHFTQTGAFQSPNPCGEPPCFGDSTIKTIKTKNTPRGVFFILTGCGGWIWTTDLQVMSLTSYRTALPRDKRKVLYTLFSDCQIKT